MVGKYNKNIVVIGGGTGSFQILRGLKTYTDNITAVVSMFDSGGSTGTLRDEMGTLPPGDIRKCLVALASEDDESDLRRLFMYRFPTESSVSGHSFGNLFITALTEIYGGDIARAIEQAGKLMKIKGRIYPVTKDDAHLYALLENGQEILGETNIDIPKHDPRLSIHHIKLTRRAKIYSKAREAIAQADIIVFGPGDLYTSILPNFLVYGMKTALKHSHACKVYVCNVMTKRGETNKFKASNFLAEMLRYLGPRQIDIMICNRSTFSTATLAKYREEGADPVTIDASAIRGVRLICENVAKEQDVARHDPIKLARIILGL